MQREEGLCRGFCSQGMGWDGCPHPRARRAQDPTRSQALAGSTFHPGRGATPQGLTRRSGSRAAWLSAVLKGKESSSRSQSFVLLAVLVLKGGQPSTVSSLENAVLISSCLCPFLLKAVHRAPGRRAVSALPLRPCTPQHRVWEGGPRLLSLTTGWGLSTWSLPSMKLRVGWDCPLSP